MGKKKTETGRQRSVTGLFLHFADYFKEDLRIISAIIGLALLLRILAAILIDYAPSPNIARDIALMDTFALGNTWDASHPPLYILFLRVVYAIGGGVNHRAVFIIQSVLNSFVVAFMFLIGRILCNRTTGVIAAALSAIYPNFIAYNLMAYPDSFGVGIVILLMAAVTIDVTGRLRTYIVSAIVGIGILVQPLLMYVWPGMLLTARKKLLLLGIVAAMLAPWAIRNSAARGGFAPVYEGSAYELDMRKYSYRRETWEPINSLYYNTSAALRKGQSGAFSMGESNLRNINYISAYAYNVIVLLGLVGMARYIRKKHLDFVVPILGYMLLVIALSNAQIRFRIHLEPLLLLYSAIFLARCYGGLRAMRERRAA